MPEWCERCDGEGCSRCGGLGYRRPTWMQSERHPDTRGPWVDVDVAETLEDTKPSRSSPRAIPWP